MAFKVLAYTHGLIYLNILFYQKYIIFYYRRKVLIQQVISRHYYDLYI